LSEAEEAEQEYNKLKDLVIYGTHDPESLIEFKGKHGPLLAMTAMLYKVCNGNQEKFVEAMRIVELFIQATHIESQKLSSPSTVMVGGNFFASRRKRET